MLYGCCTNPPSKVMDELAPLMREVDLRWQVLGTEPIKDRRLYLAVGYNTLIPHLRDLDQVRAGIIVFDSQLRLLDIEVDVWLDVNTPTLSYRFIRTDLKVDELRKLVDRLDRNEEGAVDLAGRHIDKMPRLLAELTPTGFLETYNAYILGCTGPDNRPEAHAIIGDVLFNGGSIKTMVAELTKLTSGPSAEEMIFKLRDAFDTNDGKAILRACERIAGNRKLQVKKVAEQEKVDPNALRYLVKAQAKPVPEDGPGNRDEDEDADTAE